MTCRAVIQTPSPMIKAVPIDECLGRLTFTGFVRPCPGVTTTSVGGRCCLSS